MSKFYETPIGQDLYKKINLSKADLIISNDSTFENRLDLMFNFSSLPPHSFQNIILIHALEYVPFPEQFIKTISLLVKPEGCVTCYTPLKRFNGLPTFSPYTKKQVRILFEQFYFNVFKQKNLSLETKLNLFPIPSFIETCGKKINLVTQFQPQPLNKNFAFTLKKS
ncbi:MAG: hypothetical protein MJ250_03975 [Alphaproteobacteria bacterium]|nr:hypothetical protein [Alphaproteobacteria bacterium]